MKKMLHVPSMLHRCIASGVSMVFAVICVVATTVYAQGNTGMGVNDDEMPFLPIRTNTPRDTLETFLRLAREAEETLLAYRHKQTRANAERARLLIPQLLQLIDLSSVPGATLREVGSDTVVYLLDIIGRVELPPMESVPGAGAFDDEMTPAKWRIPGTPIKIVRIGDGPREGEFLFGERTVAIVPVFYQRIRHLPLRSSLGIENWHETLPQVHGPMIPAGLVAALPSMMKQTWLDTPIWKILVAALLGVLAIFLLVLWHRVIDVRAPRNRTVAQLRRVLTPVAIILVVVTLRPFVVLEVMIAGRFAQAAEFTATLVIYLAAVWTFWLLVVSLSEWIIRSPRTPDESLDVNLLRLSARVVGFVGSVLILAYGAQELGLPVVGVVAGLGVGGLAVALAIRPTLENLIGGMILFIDKPVRIGDFCSFGDQMGTIEYIGIRSTQIRALDRTLISVPNATFADMEIINWAKCDRMLIQRTIGLRYETESDQLRYVLVNLREMFHSHPKIDRDTVRVRFEGHGASSLDIQIRVYSLTREWNEFYAVQEDVFLRVDDIVKESGTGFAFPSQTVYMGRDGGLDKERSEAVVQQVTAWRRSSRLPFPRLTPARIDELADTLDYPPRGSPDAASPQAPTVEVAEPLSAGEHAEDAEEVIEKSESERR